MQNPHKRLVVRSDDAGSSRSANRAISECATRGLARNISLMAPGPAIEDAAQVLAGLENVDFGLHVTLNSEWDSPRWGPVSPRSQAQALLEEDGAFTREPMTLFERGFSSASLEAAMEEVAAQLQKLRGLGFNLSYLDEHMGVGWLPGLRERLQVLASTHGLIVAAPVPSLPDVAGDFADSFEQLSTRISRAPGGDWVWVTHPTFDDEETRSIRPGRQRGNVASERDGDQRLLCDERLKTWCEQNKVEVVRYSQVLAPS
jgi:predicted glycoside hydrolase/deacetylase ChbG (UPF0249 family)